jgi:hypothetical protein
MMEEDDWRFNGYHIRVISYEPDQEHVDATIFNKYSTYATRAVLISVCGQSFLLSLLTDYHTDVRCASTLDAHRIMNIVIEQESTFRKKEWYLIVFPPGTALDNGIFSNHATYIQKRSVRLRTPPNQNGIVEALHFTPVYWRIADYGSGKHVGNNGANAAVQYADA